MRGTSEELVRLQQNEMWAPAKCLSNFKNFGDGVGSLLKTHCTRTILDSHWSLEWRSLDGLMRIARNQRINCARKDMVQREREVSTATTMHQLVHGHVTATELSGHPFEDVRYFSTRCTTTSPGRQDSEAGSTRHELPKRARLNLLSTSRNRVEIVIQRNTLPDTGATEIIGQKKQD